jgi:hypothetical protein
MHLEAGDGDLWAAAWFWDSRRCQESDGWPAWFGQTSQHQHMTALKLKTVREAEDIKK